MSNGTANTGSASVECGEFPRLQQRYRKVWWIWFAATLGASLILTLILPWIWVPFIIGIVDIVLLVIVSSVLSGRLTQYYKETIVPQFLGQFCEEGTYNPDAGIGEMIFRACNLFRSPDLYSTEDLIEGRIGQTAFRFAEVHAQEKRTTHTKNGTRTTWVDIFRGFFFVADFNKHFRGQTTLVPNYWGSKWLAGKQRVQLENTRLMKEFLVCSTDQTEARYLLTPGLMERIMVLWDKYPGMLSISFTGSNIIIARNSSRNCYEAGIWKALDKCLKRDLEAVRGLTGIVEELNMNTRIWSKE